MMPNRMIKVGLTGGIGSGKSTVSNYVRSKGIPIIDADKISREILNLYGESKCKLKKEFGSDYFDEQDNLKRKELGKLVFNDKKKLKKLEAITMPYIKKEIIKRFTYYRRKGHELCVLDAATLIENRLHKSMDYNILVFVDKETQIKRVIDRDNLSHEEVMNRIKSQMSLEAKKNSVDFIVDNRGELQYTFKQVQDILNEIWRS